MKKNWLGVLLALSPLLGGCAGAEAAHSKAELLSARRNRLLQKRRILTGSSKA